MAELVFKIGDGATYADGDCLAAFSDDHLRAVHCQHICHVKDAGFNSDGLRPVGSLPQKMLERFCQYRFRRVTNKTIERVRLSDQHIDVFGPESIDVELFVQRRRKHERHAIFGANGSELWYGGRTDVSRASVNALWNDIATGSDHRDQNDCPKCGDDHRLWPMGRLDVREHLAVRVTDLTATEAAAMVAPRYEYEIDGTTIKVDAEGRPVELARRNVSIDWRTELLGDLGVTESQVLDREFAVGREIEVPDIGGKFRHTSRDQPVQASRAKLHSKHLGGPVPEGTP